ncbi:hypothetical protein [Acidovorax sp. LjRoot117]|uniref:hypothetical protein n=1 Tax=Acidovorax sp. LjRoot117 TaxID=3342255 RepID=UPI003ECC80B5
MGALQWFIVPALAALASNVKSTTRIITPADLSTWATNDQVDFPLGTAEQALTALQRHDYTRPHTQMRFTKGARNKWTFTSTGMLAGQAALKAMPGAAPDMQALPTRVWNLLRIRRRLTASEAAETLIDAADNFDAQTKRIGALLAAWAKLPPHAVATGAKKEEGRIRYVLVNDLGRWPPVSKAGEMHPNAFANSIAMPTRFRKAGPSTNRQGEGHEAA